MKKPFLFILVFMFCSNILLAQSKNNFQFSAGADIGYVATYDLAVFWGTGIGGSVQAEYAAGKKFSAVLSAGYSSYLGFSLLNGDKPPAINIIAIRGGGKYYVYKQLYIGAQAGAGIAGGGGEIAVLSTFGIHGASFSYSPQLGYEFKLKNKKRLDVTAKYESCNYTKTFQTAGARIAYIF